MKNQKNDHVPSFVKVIIDRVHGGRKQDRKFWERKIGNSRNDLSGLSNGEIPIEQPEGIAQTLKQAKAKRAVLILGVLLLCSVFALVYSRPNTFPFLSYSKIYQAISEYFPEKHKVSSEPTPRTSELSNQPKETNKEYTFSQKEVLEAKNKVLLTQKIKISSPQTSSKTTRKNPADRYPENAKYIYEIELSSGRNVSAKNISTVGDIFTFENDRGLVISVAKSEVKSVRRLAINFSCTGKFYCSEMSSCEEAKFYLRNCPNTKMDGDGDGVPCEDQWCLK